VTLQARNAEFGYAAVTREVITTLKDFIGNSSACTKISKDPSRVSFFRPKSGTTALDASTNCQQSTQNPTFDFLQAGLWIVSVTANNSSGVGQSGSDYFP
jgi:hypothetical protein